MVENRDRGTDLEDCWLVGEAEGEVLELQCTARDAGGELLVQELGGEQQVALRGARTKLHHVPQAHPRLLQARPPPNLLRHRARHRLQCHSAPHVVVVVAVELSVSSQSGSHRRLIKGSGIRDRRGLPAVRYGAVRHWHMGLRGNDDRQGAIP
jgi:hypothetical protein